MDKQAAIVNMIWKMDPETDSALLDRLYDIVKRMYRRGSR